MKKHYFITGTSSGIGHALALLILTIDPTAIVIGLSRNNRIYHERYRHYSVDLAEVEKLYNFFENINCQGEVILVNNAATLGEIGYIGELASTTLVQSIAVNVTAPLVLMNEFLKSYPTLKKCIVNISSGASQRPIDGWATYCASKAALNMLGEVVCKEQELRHQDTKVFSVAVGVVDTPMQTQIRTTNDKSFSQLVHFQTLKKENQLRSPEEIAQKLYKLIQHNEDYPQGWVRL